jgi:membrane protease YdiL (CAAX protease family)
MKTIMAFIKRHPVLTYFALTLAVSFSGFLILIGPAGFLGTKTIPDALMPFVYLAMFVGPSVAGLLLTGLINGRAGFRDLLSQLLRWRVNFVWYAIAFLTAPLLMSASLFALSRTSPVFIPSLFASNNKISLVLIAVMAGVLVGIFEELGWTGFAIPRLRQRYSILATGLIVGLVWGMWHFPVFAASVSAAGMVPPVLYLGVLLFSFLPAFRVLMVWVYDRTGSLLVAILMHVSLTAFTLILQIPATGVQAVIYDLVFAAALWVFIAAVAAANRGRLLR